MVVPDNVCGFKWWLAYHLKKGLGPIYAIIHLCSIVMRQVVSCNFKYLKAHYKFQGLGQVSSTIRFRIFGTHDALAQVPLEKKRTGGI